MKISYRILANGGVRVYTHNVSQDPKSVHIVSQQEMARKLNTLSTRLWLSLRQCVPSARMTSSNAFRPCEKCDIEPRIKTPRSIDFFFFCTHDVKVYTNVGRGVLCFEVAPLLIYFYVIWGGEESLNFRSYRSSLDDARPSSADDREVKKLCSRKQCGERLVHGGPAAGRSVLSRSAFSASLFSGRLSGCRSLRAHTRACRMAHRHRPPPLEDCCHR